MTLEPRNFRHARAALGAAGLLLLMTTACAGSLGGAAARRYERDLLSELRLQKLDVAVTVAGPPTTSGPRFSVPSFEPPALTDKIRPATEDATTQAELVARLRRRLVEVGFDVRMLHGGVALSTSERPATDTSTSVPGAMRTERRRAVEVESPLTRGATVQDLLRTSQADAVLIVRVVPVDAFYVFLQNEENRILDVGGGTTPATAVRDRPDVRVGRLLVGQAFLFDRKTGARLWTRHLPDLPSDGRILPGDPFLEYGYVAPPGAPPSPSERAERGSQAFVDKMFAEFPVPSEGTADARATLDALDLESERQRQAFLDDNHFVFEVGANWTRQTVNLEGSIGGDSPIPDLETDFVAPSGAFRVEPRFSYVVAGGFTAGVGANIGGIPTDAARSYIRDSDDPDERSRGATVTLAGGTTVGVDLRLGVLLPLTADLFFWPTAGAFWERWTFDVAPETVVPEGTVDRVGALLNADLAWRFIDRWFARAGGGLRAGSASQGEGFLGFELGLSLGLFL